jgi:uncharacterized protein YcbX
MRVNNRETQSEFALALDFRGDVMQVQSLWRYPVKSTQGEQVEQVEVGALGIAGDRRRAVVDAATGVSLSAKQYAALLLCSAWTIDGQVLIRLPNGAKRAALCMRL